MYSTKLESNPWPPSCMSLSVVPSASTEISPFHFSNSRAAASSSLAFRAKASSSYSKWQVVSVKKSILCNFHVCKQYCHQPSSAPVLRAPHPSSSSFLHNDLVLFSLIHVLLPQPAFECCCHETNMTKCMRRKKCLKANFPVFELHAPVFSFPF